MIAVFSAAFAAQTTVPALRWDWDETHRLYVENEVRLPELLWLFAENNKDARVIGFQLRTLLECRGTDKESARKRLVRCTIEDIGLVGGAVPGDLGRVQPVLDEYDALLTGAAIDLVIRDDGRIADVNLHGVGSRNLRTRARNERMRLLSRYIAAALEVPLPRDAGEDTWLSSDTLMCTMPTTFGTAGQAQVVHQGVARRGLVEIATRGKALMSPGQSDNQYTCEFSGHTFFNPAFGLEKRTWAMQGEPTPGSPIAFGAAGYAYTHKGSVQRLQPGEKVDVGETLEVAPDADVPSALQQFPDADLPFGQPQGL